MTSPMRLVGAVLILGFLFAGSRAAAQDFVEKVEEGRKLQAEGNHEGALKRFQEAVALSKGELDGDAWVRRCREAGIADAALGSVAAEGSAR